MRKAVNTAITALSVLAASDASAASRPVNALAPQFVSLSEITTPIFGESRIEGLLEVPEWKRRIEENPKNRERLLGLDEAELLRLMYRWLNAYVPKPGQTIPGVDDDQFARIRVPTRIIRGGVNDADHPKRTSLEVSCLIPHAEVVDPPWPEDAWEAAGAASQAGKGSIFDFWQLGAPEFLKFIDE